MFSIDFCSHVDVKAIVMLINSPLLTRSAMFRITLNAGCRRPDGGAIDRRSCERFAIFYTRQSVCLCGCEIRFYFTTVHVRCEETSPKVNVLPINRCINWNRKLTARCDLYEYKDRCYMAIKL